MSPSAVRRLTEMGQSVWLDHAGRSFLCNGGLQGVIDEDAVSGVIFHPLRLRQALETDSRYAAEIAKLAALSLTPTEIYDRIVADDARSVADILLPIHERAHGRDGYISLPASPHLAIDADALFWEAERLRTLIDRPNVMIQVPATDAGLHASARLLEGGICVDITDIFSVERYSKVADVYFGALEKRLDAGHSIGEICAVASFGVAQIDAALDPKFEHSRASHLRGRWGVALAKAAHREYEARMKTFRAKLLSDRAAIPQRLLWVGVNLTSADEIRYADALAGRDTIVSLTLDALNAYRTRGEPSHRLGNDAQFAREVIAKLQSFGIDYGRVSAALETQALRSANACYEAALRYIANRMRCAA